MNAKDQVPRDVYACWQWSQKLTLWSLTQSVESIITTEALVQGCLKFMGMALMSGRVNVLWKYSQRAQQKIATLVLIHSSLVKPGSAKNCEHGVSGEYCLSAIEHRFGNQVARLKAEWLFWCRCEECCRKDV